MRRGNSRASESRPHDTYATGVYISFEFFCTTHLPTQEPAREYTLMKPLKRLWQWYRDRRVEHQALKGHSGDEHHRSQSPPPVTGLEKVTRFARRPPVI